MKHRIVGCVTLLVLIAASAQAALVENGGFEEFDIPTNTWNVYDAIPGWTKTSGSGIEIQDHVAGSPYEGGQHVELDSYSNSGMEQLISTTAGQSYSLSFAFSPRPGHPITTNGIDVLWEGTVLDSLTGTGASDTVWSIHQYTVTASDSTAALGFQATLTSDSLGGYVDAVSLEVATTSQTDAIPEPATIVVWSLLGMCFAGAYRLRRRNGWSQSTTRAIHNVIDRG